MRKVNCEMCGYSSKAALHTHHAVPVSQPGSTNYNNNLVVLCANCHNEVHAGIKIIEGRFLTTAGLKLFWRHQGASPIINNGIILNR